MIEGVGHNGEIDMPINRQPPISIHFTSHSHYFARRFDDLVDFIQESFRFDPNIV